MQPELGAILFADLEGYTRLVSLDEDATLAFVDRCVDRARRATRRFEGEVVKTTGDGWVAIYPSATAAVSCARSIQRLIARREKDAPGRFRIGVHLGEFRRNGGDVFGNAVNVAARIQPLADPGGVAVSQTVLRQLAARARWRFEAMGRPVLRNIGDGLSIYRLVEGPPIRAQSAALRVNLVGGFALAASDGQPTPQLSRHGTALIAALALAGAEPTQTAKLAALLWPEKASEMARAALARLRRTVNGALARWTAEAVIVDGRGARLCGTIEVDLRRIEAGLALGDVDPALARVDGWGEGVLTEVAPVSPLHAAWLSVRRDVWRERIILGLERCLERHPNAEPASRAAAETLLRLEPGHEPASLALIRHFAAHGRAEAALRECQRLTRHLADVVGGRPGPMIAAEVARLSAGGRAPAPAPARRGAARSLQIAVADFDADVAARSMAEGFRSELLANLARFRQWTTLDASGGGASRADYVLRGRCAAQADGVRLSLRLVEPASRRVAWSDAFNVSTAEWRALQRRVVGKTAAALEVYVSADRLGRTIPAAAAAAADWDEWLRGEELLLRWTPEAEDAAEALFKALIDRAPGFAAAHASLASIQNVRHIVRPGAQRLTQAAAGPAARAVELDATDARNHLALAWTAALTGAWDQAAVTLDLAVSLNPSSPTTTISAAMGYAFLGEHDKAARTLEEALAMAPMLRPHQWCYAAAVRFLGGDDAGAAAAAARSGDRIVDNQGWLAAALARQGRLAEARAAFDALAAAVAPHWRGPAPADAAAVRDWFAGAYPIRRAADREALAAALAAAAGLGEAALSGSAGR